MGSVRHETVIDVDLDTDKANAKAKQLQALIDQLSAAMRNVGGGSGGPGGGGGGGGAHEPGHAASPMPGQSPTAPTAPSGPQPAPGPVAPNVTPGGPAPVPGQAIQPLPYRPMPAPSPGPVAPNVLPSGGDDRYPGAVPSAARQTTQEREKDDTKTTTRAITTALTAAASAMTAGGPGVALGVAQSALQSAGNVAQSVGVSGAAVPVLGAAAGVTGIMLAALNYRYGVAVRRAQLDERSNALGLYGGGGWGGGGYTPEEAVGIMGSFGQGAGYSSALRDTNVLALNRTGTGVGAMAGYAGTTAAGVGGTGAPSVGSLIATAQNSGLRGAKVDDYLQRITAAITQLGESGMTLNLAGAEKFMRQLANTGAFQGAGLAQARLFTGIEGAAVGARGRALSNYASVGENALYGAALQQGGGAMGAAEFLGSISTDEKREIITRQYGREAASGYFMSLGLNEAQGRDATGPLGPDRTYGLKKYGPGALKTAYAASERALLRQVGPEDAELFKQKAAADSIIMEVGKAGQATVEGLANVVTAISGVEGTMNKIKDILVSAVKMVKGQ